MKCKESGAIKVDLKKHGRTYLSSEIDFLAVYIPDIDDICWFPPDVFHGKARLQIRLEPAKSKQVKGCVFADKYIW